MSPISQKDIETVVSLAAGPGANILDHELEPFSKTRNGIMGNHHILSVTIKTDSSSETTKKLKFFVKTVLKNAIVDDWVVIEEMHFLTEVYPLMMREYKGPRWMPACYLAKPEILVFEDARSQGFSVRSHSIFNGDECKAVLANLARLHAASILLEAKFGKPLNQVYPGSFTEKIFTDVGKGGQCNKVAFDTMALIAERFGLDGSIVPKILDRISKLVQPVKGRCNVVCHGDLWRSNIMFDSSLPPSCLLVDFQMLRYSSPVVDIAFLLYVHSMRDFRGSSEELMLRYYYEIFSEILGAKAPNYEDIRRDYEERKIVGMAYSALRWPPSMMKMRDEFDVLEKWYFGSRIDIYRRLMDDDPVYEAAMREYLEELFAEGQRMLL